MKNVKVVLCSCLFEKWFNLRPSNTEMIFGQLYTYQRKW